MSREYLFTSKQFDGSIYFGYDDQGVLIKFLNEAQLTDKQQQFLCTKFPFVESELQNILGTTGHIKEVIDVSFETFWAAYGRKVNKIRSQSLFYALSESDRQLCIQSLKKYQNFCKLNRRSLKDPDTYIRNRCWIDEL